MTVSRLLLPACSLWLGALACELIAGSRAIDQARFVEMALGLALLALLLCGLVAWRAHALRQSRSLAIVLGLGAGVVAAAMHLLPMLDEPLRSLAYRHASVIVSGVVESEGRAVVSARSRLWQLQPQYAFQLASTAVSTDAESWALALPMRIVSQQPPPAIGSHIRLRGSIAPGQLPVTAAIVQARGSIDVVSGPGLVDQVADGLRAGLRTAVADRPSDSASLVAGLSIGDQSQQSPELADAMRTAGLSHLTAVSGGNVAVIIVLVIGLARLCRLRLGPQVLLCLIALAFFVILVRPQPSVLRAAVMGAVVLVGLLTGGQRRGTGVLAVSIALLICIAPELAVSWGFALSVAATAGLILWSPTVLLGLRRRLPDWPVPLLEALAVTITAQLATAPIIIAMGSTVGMAGVPANLLAMPVVPVVTVLGLVTAGLGAVVPALAVLTGLVASWFASWIANVAFAMSALPLAAVPWPSGLPGAVLAVSLLGLVLLLRRAMRWLFPQGTPLRIRMSLVAGAVVLVLLLAWLNSPRGWPMRDWAFVACDVGQGDALVVRTGEHSAMLVDAGLDGRDVDRCLDRLDVTTLDVFVLTHFHADHVGGRSGALSDRAIGVVFGSPTRQPAGEAREVERELAQRGLVVHDVHAGDSHRVGSVVWQVLWPSRFIGEGSIPNNASVVLLVDVAGLRILLPGDVEPEAQAALIAEQPPARADISKIPHHGSRFQDPGFASWAGGQLAVVSVGLGNDYGHPAPTAMEEWARAGAQVWRTDLEGSIAVARHQDGSLDVVAFKD